MYEKTIMYETEFLPRKELFIEYIDKIKEFILSNNFIFIRKRPLTLSDIRNEKDFLVHYIQGEKYISDLYCYEFEHNNNEKIKLQVNVSNVKLFIYDTDLNDLGKEYDIVRKITDFIHITYINHSAKAMNMRNIDINDCWNSFGTNIYRSKLLVSKNKTIYNYNEMIELIKNEGLYNEYVDYEKQNSEYDDCGYLISQKIKTKYKNINLLIDRNLSNGYMINKGLGFVYCSSFYLYEENDTIFWRETFTSDLHDKLTDMAKEIKL